MTKEEILNWLKEHNINDEVCRYTFNKDMSIDVDGDVRLVKLTDGVIPDGIKFNKVTAFFCYRNNMTSLKGCPEEVENGFSCGFNKLTSLEGAPKKVGGNFGCIDNKLTTLKGCPEIVGDSFYCHDNKLTSLEGCPKEVGGDFECNRNKLINLKYMPVLKLGCLTDFKHKDVKIEQDIMKQAKTYEEGVQAYQDYLDIFGDE